MPMVFSKDVFALDPEAETERICCFIRKQVFQDYKRKGAVVGLSGGVDSALIASLCARALGVDRVLGLLLPEKESNPVSEPYAREQAAKLGIRTERVDLMPLLTAMGVYDRKNEVIRHLCPGFDPDRDKTKISLPPNLLERQGLNVFTLTVTKPDGSSRAFRLGAEDFRAIEAAQNMKQRTRMMQLYYHAEKLHYIVCGTTNKTENDQGFFVKFGDGGVDIEPIAHLYKAQVYQLARHLGVTENILNRTPSPDTWSGRVSDEEFYFRMPYHVLDQLLYAWNNDVPNSEIRDALGLTDEQIARAFGDFDAKHKATAHLRTGPASIAS